MNVAGLRACVSARPCRIGNRSAWPGPPLVNAHRNAINRCCRAADGRSVHAASAHGAGGTAVGQTAAEFRLTVTSEGRAARDAVPQGILKQARMPRDGRRGTCTADDVGTPATETGWAMRSSPVHGASNMLAALAATVIEQP